jgi:hypothetical protein
MASKKRDLGAGNTEASEKNAPLKSSANTSRASRRGQRKNPHRPTKNRADSGTRGAFTVYDGQVLLGKFVWNKSSQQALAWDAARRFIGRFNSFRAAARAISQTTRAAEHMADARHHLDDPNPPYVTGLPEHFLRGG